MRNGVWGTADPVNGVAYRQPDGTPATTWELMQELKLIEANWTGRTSFYPDPGRFMGAAIVNYVVWEYDKYDYTVSGLNGYSRSILKMSTKGWPGGLRWLSRRGRVLSRTLVHQLHFPSEVRVFEHPGKPTLVSADAIVLDGVSTWEGRPQELLLPEQVAQRLRHV